MALAVVCAACYPDSPGGTRTSTMGGEGGGRREEVPLTGPEIYVAAVTYPQDWDWRNCPDGIAAPWENILLLRGVDTVCCVRTGAQNRIGDNPEHMHIIDGHLFTEYMSEGVTSLSRDGRLLYEYEGMERLAAIRVFGGRIYTLGVRKDGAGFCLRADGVPIYQDTEGTLVEGMEGPGSSVMDMVEGTPVFAFSRATAGKGREWMLCKGGSVERILIPAGVEEIYSARLYGGHLYLAASRSGGEAPVLVEDGDCYSLGDTIDYDELYGFTLVPEEDEMRIAGRYKQHFTGHVRSDIFAWDITASWDRERLTGWYYGTGYLYRSGGNERFVRIKDGRLFMVSWPPRSNKLDWRPDGDYAMYSYACGALRDTTLYMGLTPLHSGGQPLLWMGGRTRTVPVNGYIVAISVEQ